MSGAAEGGEAEGESHKVMVYQYDLSGGMAAAFSEAMLGRRLDGIWHTSVVVYGREYYYGGGITSALPGHTPAGPTPTKKLDFGTTDVPQWLFEDFLKGLKDTFKPEAYHLLRQNCNHFTDEAVQMLTGKPLPEEISGLPEAFASTPLGQMLAPMIDSFFQRMQQPPVP